MRASRVADGDLQVDVSVRNNAITNRIPRGATQLTGTNPYEAPHAGLTPPLGNRRQQGSQRFLTGFLLSAIHLVYATFIGLVIYLRHRDYGWVSLAWLPGSVQIHRFGRLIGPAPLMGVGWDLLFGGSILAGTIAMQALRALASGEADQRGGWKLLLALLLWCVWLRVPLPGTIFYWFEAY
jgi:hypothetical protein